MTNQTAKNKKQKPDLVEVTLIKNHTDRGQTKKIGEKIKILADQADWLRDQGVIE